MNINDSYQMKGEKYVVTLAVGVYPTLVNHVIFSKSSAKV